MDAKNLKVDPEVIRTAAAGINGVITDLSSTPVIGSYAARSGRGFTSLQMSGKESSSPVVKTALDAFCSRWEWGTRALIQVANKIGSALNLGAGAYELKEDYISDAFKDYANDLIGDPSLQQHGTKDRPGTNDLSWGQLWDHNYNKLRHPDYSAKSFTDTAGDVRAAGKQMRDSFATPYGLPDPAVWVPKVMHK